MTAKPTLTILCCLSLMAAMSRANGAAGNPGKTQDTLGVVKEMHRISLLSPGYDYERKLGQYSTFSAFAAVKFSFQYYTSTNGGSETYYVIQPNLDVQYRYYVNYQLRKSKGKSTDNNSANYICLSANVFTPALAYNTGDFSEFGVSIGPKYGIQRCYDNHIFFRVDFGLGVLITPSTTDAGALTNLAIGMYL